MILKVLLEIGIVDLWGEDIILGNDILVFI